MPIPRDIHVAAALIVRPSGELLLVRKAGTTSFMQPGGKIEPGEEAVAALQRELREELQVVVSPSATRYLGRYSAAAANEPGCRVTADLFHVELGQAVAPAAEIAEILWLHPDRVACIPLAPLSRDWVLPMLAPGGRGLLR